MARKVRDVTAIFLNNYFDVGNFEFENESGSFTIELYHRVPFFKLELQSVVGQKMGLTVYHGDKILMEL